MGIDFISERYPCSPPARQILSTDKVSPMSRSVSSEPPMIAAIAKRDQQLRLGASVWLSLHQNQRIRLRPDQHGRVCFHRDPAEAAIPRPRSGLDTWPGLRLLGRKRSASASGNIRGGAPSCPYHVASQCEINIRRAYVRGRVSDNRSTNAAASSWVKMPSAKHERAAPIAARPRSGRWIRPGRNH